MVFAAIMRNTSAAKAIVMCSRFLSLIGGFGSPTIKIRHTKARAPSRMLRAVMPCLLSAPYCFGSCGVCGTPAPAGFHHAHVFELRESGRYIVAVVVGDPASLHQLVRDFAHGHAPAAECFEDQAAAFLRFRNNSFIDL